MGESKRGNERDGTQTCRESRRESARARKKEMGPRHGRDRERVCETENERDRTETCVTERERWGKDMWRERKKRRVEYYCIV